VHSTVDVSVAHETTNTVVPYSALSSAATCELEHRHCEIGRFVTVSVSRVTGVVTVGSAGVVVIVGVVDVVTKGVVTLGVVVFGEVTLGVVVFTVGVVNFGVV
jgi:hypothetical protein